MDRSPKANISATCKTLGSAKIRPPWVEICYCPTPLQEERPYWEQFFDLTRVQDAHDRRKCRDHNGTEPWACDGCDCTARLEEKLDKTGKSFMESLRAGELTLINPLPQSGSGPTK